MEYSFEILSLDDVILEIDKGALTETVNAECLPDYDGNFFLFEGEVCIALEEGVTMELTVLGQEGTYLSVNIPFEPATELIGARPARKRPYGI